MNSQDRTAWLHKHRHLVVSHPAGNLQCLSVHRAIVSLPLANTSQDIPLTTEQKQATLKTGVLLAWKPSAATWIMYIIPLFTEGIIIGSVKTFTGRKSFVHMVNVLCFAVSKFTSFGYSATGFSLQIVALQKKTFCSTK